MKNFLMIVGATLISATAFAQTDWAFLGYLKPHQAVSKNVILEEGTTEINVRPEIATNKISCKFMDEAGNVGLEQSNTNRCSGNFVLTSRTTLVIKVYNENNKEIDFRIETHPLHDKK